MSNQLTDLLDGHWRRDTQNPAAVEDSIIPTGHGTHDIHTRPAAGGKPPRKERSVPGFNLRQLIREVLIESDETEPSMLAGIVRQRMSGDDVFAAVDQLLTEAVRQEIGNERRRVSAPEPQDSEADDEQDETDESEADAGRKFRSAKVTGIRQWFFQNKLRTRIRTAEGYKFLGECTAEDFDFAAKVRRAMAEANTAEAERLEKWAAVMREYGVDHFPDLPADVLAALLGDAS